MSTTFIGTHGSCMKPLLEATDIVMACEKT
jgi:hypothetical protein